MRSGRFGILFVTLAVSLVPQGLSAVELFSVFPKAGRLVSPDKRYEVRDAGPAGSAGSAGSISDFVGNFHSLWLVESSTGRSRKLCDYLGEAAVAWSEGNALLITEYVGKKTSRAWLFAPVTTEQAIVIDQAALLRVLEPPFREVLRSNDHTFVEAVRVDKNIFYFRVWGYGRQAPKGFKWSCQYGLAEATLGCKVD